MNLERMNDFLLFWQLEALSRQFVPPDFISPEEKGWVLRERIVSAGSDLALAIASAFDRYVEMISDCGAGVSALFLNRFKSRCIGGKTAIQAFSGSDNLLRLYLVDIDDYPDVVNWKVVVDIDRSGVATLRGVEGVSSAEIGALALALKVGDSIPESASPWLRMLLSLSIQSLDTWSLVPAYFPSYVRLFEDLAYAYLFGTERIRVLDLVRSRDTFAYFAGYVETTGTKFLVRRSATLSARPLDCLEVVPFDLIGTRASARFERLQIPEPIYRRVSPLDPSFLDERLQVDVSECLEKYHWLVGKFGSWLSELRTGAADEGRVREQKLFVGLLLPSFCFQLDERGDSYSGKLTSVFDVLDSWI